MSGLTEQEIIDKHIQSLKEGEDACKRLFINVDPEKAAPRGVLYGRLRRSLQELEGTCRQMAAWRDDVRWTKLGFVYARAMRVAQAEMTAHNWAAFGELSKLFQIGLVRMDELKNRKTGKIGPILPTGPVTWTQIPDIKLYRTPQRIVN